MLGFYSNYSAYDSWFRHMQEARNREEHRVFTMALTKKQMAGELPPESISVLTRAVNKPKLRTHIRQPAWRAGRWKSLT